MRETVHYDCSRIYLKNVVENFDRRNVLIISGSNVKKFLKGQFFITFIQNTFQYKHISLGREKKNWGEGGARRKRKDINNKQEKGSDKSRKQNIRTTFGVWWKSKREIWQPRKKEKNDESGRGGWGKKYISTFVIWGRLRLFLEEGN